MPWIRLEDTFPEHPKVLKAGGEAAWFHVRAIAYCSRHLTDGFVPRIAAKEFAPKAWAKLSGRLIRAGMWDATEGGYQIHDYLHYQPSREHTLERRAVRAAAGKEGARVTNLQRWRRQTVGKESSS